MYKLKDGVNLPKEFKIKVNPEQSEALQLHLFSIGKTWASVGEKVQNFGYHYLYCHSYANIGQGDDKKKFKVLFPSYERIKFKDYFEKVTNQFPEKWCTEITEDNCNELNVYLHRNWKDYWSYSDKWKVDCIGEYFYNSPITYGCCIAKQKSLFEHELITIQQFREKFGIVKINETEIKAMESNIDYWHERANYHKQRCKDLRAERYEMSKEIEQLKSELALYNSLKQTLISIAKKD